MFWAILKKSSMGTLTNDFLFRIFVLRSLRIPIFDVVFALPKRSSRAAKWYTKVEVVKSHVQNF
jgi:hypothetical protein